MLRSLNNTEELRQRDEDSRNQKSAEDADFEALLRRFDGRKKREEERHVEIERQYQEKINRLQEKERLRVAEEKRKWDEEQERIRHEEELSRHQAEEKRQQELARLRRQKEVLEKTRKQEQMERLRQQRKAEAAEYARRIMESLREDSPVVSPLTFKPVEVCDESTVDSL